jgi:hypothetical protein
MPKASNPVPAPVAPVNQEITERVSADVFTDDWGKVPELEGSMRPLTAKDLEGFSDSDFKAIAKELANGGAK